MLSTAYQLGVQAALEAVGLVKEAGKVTELAKRLGGAIARNPALSGTLLGSGLGAGTGLAYSAAADRDNILRNVLLGALAGGGLGAATGAVAGRSNRMLAALSKPRVSLRQSGLLGDIAAASRGRALPSSVAERVESVLREMK